MNLNTRSDQARRKKLFDLPLYWKLLLNTDFFLQYFVRVYWPRYAMQRIRLLKRVARLWSLLLRVGESQALRAAGLACRQTTTYSCIRSAVVSLLLHRGSCTYHWSRRLHSAGRLLGNRGQESGQGRSLHSNHGIGPATEKVGKGKMKNKGIIEFWMQLP